MVNTATLYIKYSIGSEMKKRYCSAFLLVTGKARARLLIPCLCHKRRWTTGSAQNIQIAYVFRQQATLAQIPQMAYQVFVDNADATAYLTNARWAN